MLISHRKKFIYTKTVKTAGTSVESYFEKYCMPEGEWEFAHLRDEHVSEAGIIGYRGFSRDQATWFNHMPARKIREKIGDATWNEYFKFCVIRDPFDKLVSRFYAWGTDSGKADVSIDTFRQWIRSESIVFDRNKYLIDEEPCIDYFIRYENLAEGVAEVCRKLDIPFEAESIPTLKIGNRNREIPLSDYYDDESIEIVARIYRFELETFGYTPPG